MKLNFLASFALIAAVGAFAGSANAGAYLPLTSGDTAYYNRQGADELKLTVTATEGNWRKIQNFLGDDSRWVNSAPSSEAVYIKGSTGKIQLLANFNDPVGARYAFNLGICSTGARLAQKNLTLTTEAGTFNKVVRLDFINNCTDVGLTSAWFAPQVGLIQWNSLTKMSENIVSLAAAKIAGKEYPAALGLVMSAETPLSQVAIGHALTTVVSVANNSASPAELTFAGGQNYDAILLDANGQEVKRWSDGRTFNKMIRIESMAAGEKRNFVISMKAVDRDGLALPEGQYTLRVEFKGQPAGLGSKPLTITMPVFLVITT